MVEDVTDEGQKPTPVEQVPVEEAPAETVEAAPVEETPAETVEAAPVDNVPADEAPVPQLEPLKPESIKPKGPRIPLPSSLQEIVGALLFASETPLTAGELRACVRGVAPDEGDDAEVMAVYQSCTGREIDQALHGLEKELERSGCGFKLVCAGGAYRLQTAPACGRYVRALLKLDRPNRLSRAALETLAIIAYRQPITKAEIEQIRGVAVDTIVKSLVDLQLVRLVGRSELPGHPFLYGTSPLFLEHFGLASLSELNALDPTLQRSNPRERAKLFVKEKKTEEQTAPEQAAVETPPETPEAAPTEEGAVPVEGAETDAAADDAATTSRRVSFRPDDDEALIDDTPDETVDGDEDDESLVDDEDDESLVDDEDDESLVDDEDDEDEDADEDEDVDDEASEDSEGETDDE